VLSGKYAKTLNGRKRPVDVVGNAVHIKRIATGEIEEVLTDDGKNKAAVQFNRWRVGSFDYA